MAEADSPSRKPSRVAHPWRVLVTVVVLAGLLAGAFVLGHQFQQPSWQQAQQAASPIEVWATAENRVVDDSATFAGVVSAGATIAVKAAGLPSVAVVTRRGVTPGNRAAFGSLAAVISGDPYFLLPGPLPLYRDLAAGDAGDDVAALQRSLTRAGYEAPVTGTVGSRTIAATRELFASDGFVLPTRTSEASSAPASASPSASPSASVPVVEPVIPFRQLLTLPAEGTVTGSVTVATTVTEDTALVSVRTSSTFVQFTADVVSADALKPGGRATIRSQSGTTIAATIRSVGAFHEGTGSELSGKPVRIEPVDQKAALPVGQSVTVVTAGSHASGVAVPLTAVRQDASGSYVVLRHGSSSPGTASPGSATVRITVERSADGWAAVTGDVSAGDAVKVSG